MPDRYEPGSFEPQWRQRWKDADLFVTRSDPGRPKFYGLDFFPYPSGAGLSVGHCRNYIPTDVLCRMKYMQGYNVLHPMGFDAFGLPAENEAIKRKRHPAPMIDDYAATYRRQMDLVGIGYDWSRSFKSCDPTYYKWTQWIFSLLHERGLAYRRMATVNWDPVDKTVLADEEVIAGRAERSGALVEKKLIPQWFFRITAYAQRLIDDLDDVDWPEGIKQMQRNWIGRSEGVEFAMKVDLPAAESSAEELQIQRKDDALRVFTTRIDTVFGMTFCVIAPEHPMVDRIKKSVDAERQELITNYQQEASRISEATRQTAEREKTGVFSGAYAINPVNGEKVPIFIADYVMMGYGTGAIMAVPAHDQRDFDFAAKFDIAVRAVIRPGEAYLREHFASEDFREDLALEHYLGNVRTYETVFDAKDGVLVNSGEYSGKSVADAQKQLAEWFEACELGERKINYKLRDWLISRQRYWGCPIPVIHDKEGNEELVPAKDLPVYLPTVDHYEPSDDGSSPLTRIAEFVNVTDSEGRLARRETDTMGGFACSSWYFLRFCDPHNDEAAWDPKVVAEWMPVDTYVGGAEHAVMHLLYARFWTKVLYDAGLVAVKEPFQRLKNQGQVLAKTPYRKPREGETLDVGEEGVLVSFEEAKGLADDDVTWKWVRMSKSKGNVVTPDEAVEAYGADALRLYELFVAPFDQDVMWSSDGIQGLVRFLHRVFKFATDYGPGFQSDWAAKIGSAPGDGRAADMRRLTHQLILKASADIERFAFNTYVSAMMVFLNGIQAILKDISSPTEAESLAVSEALECLTLVLSPAAPHTADEIWVNHLGRSGFTYHANWPQGSEAIAAENEVTIAVQVNGKLRDSFTAPAGTEQSALEAMATAREKVRAHTDGKTVRKVIVIPDKLVNIVAT